MDNEPIYPNNQDLIGASGHKLQNKGVAIKSLYYKNKRFDQVFYILDKLPNDLDAILGMDFLQSTNTQIKIQRGRIELEIDSNISRNQHQLNIYKISKLTANKNAKNKTKTETATKQTINKISKLTTNKNAKNKTETATKRTQANNDHDNVLTDTGQKQVLQQTAESSTKEKLSVFVVNENTTESTEYLRTISKTTIPPKSSKMIEVKCDNKKDRTVLIEQCKETKVTLEQTVDVIRNNGKTNIIILNSTEEVLYIEKNEKVGTATPLTEDNVLSENTLIKNAHNFNNNEYTRNTEETRDDLFPLINERTSEERISILNKWVTNQKYTGETGIFLTNLIKTYGDTFHVDGDKHDPVPGYEYEIELKDKNARIKSKSYPIPQNAETEVHRQINELLRVGIISKHMSDHVNPLVVVKSKNKVRLVLDLRETNKLIKDAVFEMPDLRDSLSKLGNKSIFTTLDLKQAFLSIKLNPDSRKYTAFCVRNMGTFAYNRLPFGLKSSPRIFFQHIIKVIQQVNDPDILFYIDDIIISSTSRENHEKSIKKLFDVLKEHCLKVNIEKSCWFTKKVKFLGHEVSTSGIRPDSGKIELMEKIKRPASIKQVRSFLGLANFFRNFIPELSRISEPLTDLTRGTKQKKFIWSEKAEESFLEVKRRLKSNLKLRYPDFKKDFHLQTDASDYASGGILYQLDEFGQVQPTAFLSKSFSKSERNFSTYEKEMLAVLHGLRQVRHLVLFSRVNISTDHKPLIYLMKSSKRSMSSRNVRWIVELGEYNLTLSHISGEKNNIADFLSRLKEDLETVEVESTGINAVFKNLHEYNASSKKSGKSLHYINAIINNKINQDETAVAVELPEKNQQNTDEQPENSGVFQLLDENEISDLKQKQEKNEKLKAIIDKLQTRKNPECKNTTNELNKYFLCDGLLYSKVNTRFVIILPNSEWETKIIKITHSGALGCHIGPEKVRRKMLKHFWMNKMTEKIKTYVDNCMECNKAKPRREKKAALGSLEEVTEPFQRVHIDLIGGLGTTRKQNNWILVIVDAFSRFAYLKAIKSKTASDVARTLMEVFFNGVFPAEIFTDFGKEFRNNVLEEITKVSGIKHSTSIPLNPMSNSLVEKPIQFVSNMLRALNLEKEQAWDDLLNLVGFSYNTSYHKALNNTPAYVMFGIEGSINPLSYDINKINDSSTSSSESLRLRTRKMQEIWKKVQDWNSKYKEKYTKFYNLKTRKRPAEIGDIVFTENKTIHETAGKLQEKFVGPYRVTEKLSPTTYVIKDLYSSQTLKRHRNQLKILKLKEEDIEKEEEKEPIINYNLRSRKIADKN